MSVRIGKCEKCKEETHFCLGENRFICCICCGQDIKECLKGEKSDQEWQDYHNENGVGGGIDG